jgi:hypothetical protein
MKCLNRVSEIFVCFFLLDFQPTRTGGSPGYDHGLSPAVELGSDVLSLLADALSTCQGF